ncbi:MAG: DUF4388 domain-containing protein [Deltaproteobacteria bacterium]|nr:DUF4388 domain-containing protein [Deltaproteobacteria bacterium]
MPLEGTLNYLDVAHLLQVVGASQKSGVLEISWEGRWARLVFERGDLLCAEASACHDGIGTLLVKAGLLSGDQLEAALARQRDEGPGPRRLGAILCDEFGIEPEDIERLLREQFERVALDVFSWPGGRFVFRFREPGSAGDRFRLDAVEFILAVGIRAGLLVEKALERDRSATLRPRLIFLDRDEALLGRYREHWQRKGYAVTCCAAPSEVVAALDLVDEPLTRVVVAGWDRDASGGVQDLLGLQSRYSDVAIVEVGGGASGGSVGGGAIVCKPSPEELGGPHGDMCFAVFMVSLERALTQVLGGSGDAPS